MPIHYFKCLKCNREFRSLQEFPVCCKLKAKKQLTAPKSKFLEARDPEAKERGKSQLKGHDSLIRERARNYKRDHELHDYIQLNEKDDAKKYGWLNENGRKRKKIDDL